MRFFWNIAKSPDRSRAFSQTVTSLNPCPDYQQILQRPQATSDLMHGATFLENRKTIVIHERFVSKWISEIEGLTRLSRVTVGCVA